MKPLYTDLKTYDVGSGLDADRNRLFDTPTLIESWRTAPYLYDGRAESIDEVLIYFNKNDLHGMTTRFTYKEIYFLSQYVLVFIRRENLQVTTVNRHRMHWRGQSGKRLVRRQSTGFTQQS